MGIHQSQQRNVWFTSQDAKVDLKLLIVAIIPIYCLSETINVLCFLFFSIFIYSFLREFFLNETEMYNQIKTNRLINPNCNR